MKTKRFIPPLMIVASLGAVFAMNSFAQEASLPIDGDKTPRVSGVGQPKGIQGQGIHVVETDDGIAAYSDSLGKWDRVVVGPRDDGKSLLTQATVGMGGIAAVVVNDELFGFSSKRGHWLRHRFPPEFRGKVSPTVGIGVAAVTIGDELFGMNGSSQHWGRMTIPVEFRGKVHPTVGAGKAHTEIGNKTFVLSSTTGEWTSPDEPNTAALEEPTVPESRRREFERSRRSPSSPVDAQLTSEIAQRETQAAVVAAKIRKLTNEQGKDNASTIEARRELDRELDAALDLRFQREELQVRELQSRLSRLEQMIGQRKAQRSDIIERRANELIEGNALKWDRSDSTDDVPKVEPSSVRQPRISDFEPQPYVPREDDREKMLQTPLDSTTNEPFTTNKDLDFIYAFHRAKLKSSEAKAALIQEHSKKNGVVPERLMRQVERESEIANRNWLLMQERFKAMYEDLQLQYESGDVAVKQAQSEHDRQVPLFEAKVISRAELFIYEGKLRQAELARSRMKLRLDLFAKANLELSPTDKTNPPAKDQAGF